MLTQVFSYVGLVRLAARRHQRASDPAVLPVGKVLLPAGGALTSRRDTHGSGKTIRRSRSMIQIMKEVVDGFQLGYGRVAMIAMSGLVGIVVCGPIPRG